MEYLILAINPGSTSTKIALYKNNQEIFKDSIEHSFQELEKYDSLIEQIPMRKALVLESLDKHGYYPKDLAIVMGRGGLFPPIKTGGYLVNDKMLDLVINEIIPSHASNLGCVLAYEIAQLAGVKAYIYDAVGSGELSDMARITGLVEVTRESLYHVLNSRASAIRYAESINKSYDELNLIVAHLGGGISIGAHQKGIIIDTISDDGGPFSPERAGVINSVSLINLAFSGKYDKKELTKKFRGLGGLRDHLGTSNGKEIAQMVENGDQHAILIMQAQAYQIAKGIGLLSIVLKGDIDAIILTGGLAYNKKLISDIKQYISFLAPIEVLPGEYEMEALALGGLRILNQTEDVHEM